MYQTGREKETVFGSYLEEFLRLISGGQYLRVLNAPFWGLGR